MKQIIKILNELESKSINPTKITFYPNHNINLEFHYQIDPDQPVSKLTFDLPVAQIDYQTIANLNHHYLTLISQNHFNSTINFQPGIVIKILNDIQLHLPDFDRNQTKLVISVENNRIKFENLSTQTSYQIDILTLNNNYQQDLINASNIIKVQSDGLEPSEDQGLEFEIEDEKTKVFLDANVKIKTQLRKIVQALEKQKLIQGLHTFTYNHQSQSKKQKFSEWHFNDNNDLYFVIQTKDLSFLLDQTKIEKLVTNFANQVGDLIWDQDQLILTHYSTKWNFNQALDAYNQDQIDQIVNALNQFSDLSYGIFQNHPNHQILDQYLIKNWHQNHQIQSQQLKLWFNQKTKQLEAILSYTYYDFQQKLQVQKLALKTILNPHHPFSKWFNNTDFNFFNPNINQIATTKNKELK